MTDRRLRAAADLDAIHFGKAGGLVPVVAQDVTSGQVLMVAFANRDALERSLASGRMHYWSRSRAEIWRKGDTSGHVQHVSSLHLDCDADTVLALVRQEGPACHTGERTCFGDGAGSAGDPGASDLSRPDRPGGPGGPGGPDGPGGDPGGPGEQAPGAVLDRLDALLAARAADRPAGSYTVRLLDDENLRLKKLGEECAELVMALAQGSVDRVPEEAADLVYHVLVAARAAGVGLDRIADVLEERAR